MDMPRNLFKESLLAGKLQIGLWCSLVSPIAMEIVGDSGFDWLMIDTEHSPAELPDVLACLQALGPRQSSAVVRPAWSDPILVKRMLDIGAQTILLPYVQDAEDAQRAVASTRYPPQGIRGVTGSGRASRYGRVKNYLRQAADELCVLVQAETRRSLEQLEAIATTPGIDGVFIGPSDLAASFEHIGEPHHPEVQAAIHDAVQRLQAVGKPAGILTTDESEARRYIDWGFRFVAVGTDIGLLARGADRLTQAFQSPK
jgi:4-hydroxy-2-oxoheptanedioate aldolase